MLEAGMPLVLNRSNSWGSGQYYLAELLENETLTSRANWDVITKHNFIISKYKFKCVRHADLTA